MFACFKMCLFVVIMENLKHLRLTMLKYAAFFDDVHLGLFTKLVNCIQMLTTTIAIASVLLYLKRNPDFFHSLLVSL
jgi:hypothetical protein